MCQEATFLIQISNTNKQTNKSMIQMCPYEELIQMNPKENHEYLF